MPETEQARLKLMRDMIRVGALSIRDIENGEEPFTYSSGNKGPGYVLVKGLVSQRRLLTDLVTLLAYKVADAFPAIEYVSGNATGGMIPSWILAEALEHILGREVPHFYVRGTRKVGGHRELITGDTLNPFFSRGRRGIVMEELVNFAETTVNSALVQRDTGYEVNYGATILNYDHDASRYKLRESGIVLIHLMTLEELLAAAEEVIEPRLVDDYRSFLAGPAEWMSRHGFKKEEV